MSNRQLGVLHTDSRYMFPRPALPTLKGSNINFNDKVMKMIRDLQTKEDAFAARFGYSDCEEMIADIRKILHDNPEDLKALQQFSSTNLRAHLRAFKSRNVDLFKGRRINLRFKTTKSKNDIDKILRQIKGEFGVGSFSVKYYTDSSVSIGLVWDTGAIKSLVNKMDSHQLKTHNLTGTERLMEILYNQSDNLIDVTIGSKQQQSLQTFILNNFDNPFALKKEELDSATIAQIRKIKTAIKNFIINTLCAGASREFKNVVDSVLQMRLTNNVDDLLFFQGGDNWINNIVGAAGELQTAILFQYISRKCKSPQLSSKFVEILGDKKNIYSQSLHTDLELFNSFGIQVKNYSGDINKRTGKTRTVQVNLHPSEIPALAGTPVVDYLANIYFNANNGDNYSEGEWNSFFLDYGPELLNLNVDTTIPDKVVFYMIGGNFIPGSVLLGHAYIAKTIDVESHINIPQNRKDDAYYNESGGSKSSWHQPFHEWWEEWINPPVTGLFSPTDKNEIGIWDRNVSIRTRFTYTALFDGAYKIF